jgi:hypothetical protein
VSAAHPSIRVTDLIPAQFHRHFGRFDASRISSFNMEKFCMYLSEGLRKLAFYRAMEYLHPQQSRE